MHGPFTEYIKQKKSKITYFTDEKREWQKCYNFGLSDKIGYYDSCLQRIHEEESI